MCNRFTGSEPTKRPLSTIYLSLIQITRRESPQQDQIEKEMVGDMHRSGRDSPFCGPSLRHVMAGGLDWKPPFSSSAASMKGFS